MLPHAGAVQPPAQVRKYRARATKCSRTAGTGAATSRRAMQWPRRTERESQPASVERGAAGPAPSPSPGRWIPEARLQGLCRVVGRSGSFACLPWRRRAGQDPISWWTTRVANGSGDGQGRQASARSR
jgi:hypothetical protein